jgi:histidine decarboxylase
MEATGEYSIGAVVEGAIAPSTSFCMGYPDPGASGGAYVSTLKLSLGLVAAHGLDDATAEIVAFDRAEADDAYLGQVNLIAATSFTGLNGAVWGHDLARANAIALGALAPLFSQPQAKGSPLPVFSLDPLLDATRRLFGTRTQRCFPPMPGVHVVSALKKMACHGGTWVWAALALAIAADRARDASLFVEDAGTFGDASTPPTTVDCFLRETEGRLAKAVVLCGENQGVIYRSLFLGCRKAFVPSGYVGTALACAPYITLARSAVPPGRPASALAGMSITDWERTLGLPPLTDLA